MAFPSSHDKSALSVQHSREIPDFGTLSQDFLNNEPTTVQIPSNEYLRLVTIARQYANLCQSLISGGIDQDTIDILSNTPGNQQPPSDMSYSNETTVQMPVPANSTVRGQGLDPTRPSYTSSHVRTGVPPREPATQQFKSPVTQTDSDTDTDSDSEENYVGTSHLLRGPVRPVIQREAVRTLQLTNLPEGVIHADITAVVRGGMLLDVFLRRRDGAACISFLHAEDAEAYYRYVCKHDIYIKDKRVDFAWSERQFVLPNHVAHKISSGATRNIVIKRCDPNLTEESVRDDLDHIHNLIVVSVSFIGDNCFIATNSVSGATFARSCMMSRLKYRGSRIEWDSDECAQSLDRMPVRKFHSAPVVSAAPRKPLTSLTNRFQILDMDEVSP